MLAKSVIGAQSKYRGNVPPMSVGSHVSRRKVLQGGSAALLSTCSFASSESVRSAAEFVDSVGVNTHLFSSEAYAERFELVTEALRVSGIRHLRDELRPTDDLDRWRSLCSRHRIRLHLLVSPVTNTASEMLDYVQHLGVGHVSAIEGQNEGDSDWFMSQPQAGADWSETVVAYQREIFETLRAQPGLDALPIASPTVLDWKPADMRLIQAAARYCDLVAIHSYVQHAEKPETTADYSAISWYLRHMRDAFKPGAPVMATETGYNTMVRFGGAGVSEKAAAIYIPRLLLNNFASGIQRTFLYQLLDGGSDPHEWEHHFGLIRHDNTAKPAYRSVVSLLKALTIDDSHSSSDYELRVLC